MNSRIIAQSVDEPVSICGRVVVEAPAAARFLGAPRVIDNRKALHDAARRHRGQLEGAGAAVVTVAIRRPGHKDGPVRVHGERGAKVVVRALLKHKVAQVGPRAAGPPPRAHKARGFGAVVPTRQDDRAVAVQRHVPAHARIRDRAVEVGTLGRPRRAGPLEHAHVASIRFPTVVRGRPDGEDRAVVAQRDGVAEAVARVLADEVGAPLRPRPFGREVRVVQAELVHDSIRRIILAVPVDGERLARVELEVVRVVGASVEH